MKIKLVFNFTYVLSLFVSQAVMAQRAPNAGESIPHFQAGQYKLVTGDDLRCGDGTFEIIALDEGKYLQLGGRNGFFIENKKQQIKSDDPKEKQCTYHIERQMTFKTDSAELVYTSKKMCNGKVTRDAKETFFIEKGKISMNSVATGEEALSYNCYWEKSN